MSDESTVLGELAAAEHAAVFGYGVLGAHLSDGQQVLALSAYDAHRVLRDSVLARLTARDLPTPAPSLAYAMPAGSAVQQAIALEDGLCVLWRDLVGATDSRDLRGLAVRALSDAAVRAARWRQAAGQRPATVPFPGQV